MQVESAASAVEMELRVGSQQTQGNRKYQEDAICTVEDIMDFYPSSTKWPEDTPQWRAFYAVFDGHGGPQAALFCKENLLSYIVGHDKFPEDIESCMVSRLSWFELDSPLSSLL